jgi:acyl dehydratase
MSDNIRRGLWFEEFTEGLTSESRGRTITETDLVNFSGVSGDFNPMHTDAEYVKGTDYKARVAHGALTFSVATGLAYQQGFLEGTVIAFTTFEMKLRAPVYIGDTIKVATKVIKRHAKPSLGGGFISFDVKVTNQNGQVVQKGEWTVLVRSDPALVKSEADGASAETA